MRITNNQWAIFALRDIQNALCCDRQSDVFFHIDDAIKAIQKNESCPCESEQSELAVKYRS